MNVRETFAWLQHWHEAGAFADCSSEQVLERYVSTRDEAAFRELMHRHAGHVWAVCRRDLPCPGLAEDAFQATFVALLRKAGQVRKPGSLPAWLDRIARREAGRLRRAQRRRAEVEAAVRTPGESETAPAEVPAVVRRAVNDLPEKYRLPIVYRYLLGLSTADVARTLGLPEETGRTRLSRGLELLRRKLVGKGLGIGVGGMTVESVLSAAIEEIPLRVLSATAKRVAAAAVAGHGLTAGLLNWFSTKRIAAAAILIGGTTVALLPAPAPRNSDPQQDSSMRVTPLVALAAAVGLAPAAKAQPTTIPVVMFGTPTPVGGVFSNAYPFAVNQTGQVVLNVLSADAAVFSGTPGALQVVADRQNPAPGGGTFAVFDDNFFSFNSSGQSAFNAQITPTGSGVFVGTPGSLQRVTFFGSPAPAGGNYRFVNALVFNDAGQLAINYSLTGGTSTNGIFVGTPGSLQTLAVQNTPSPFGGTWNVATASQVRINESGQVLFRSNLTGASASGGLFIGTPGSIQAVAFQGSPAPSGGNFSGIGFNRSDINLNRAGQALFHSTLTGGSASSGLFFGTPGALQTVALQGTPAPSGGNFGSFVGEQLTLNGAGRLAVSVNLTGGSSTRGLFAGTAGNLETVALIGSAAPGGGSFSEFGYLAINRSGQVAFTANLAESGTVGPNTYDGIYVSSGSGVGLTKVIGRGDQIDVDAGPGVNLRTVRTVEITARNGFGEESGGQTWFNGEYLAYTAVFTDNSGGLFRTQLVPVPEPAGVLAAAFGLLAFGRWMGRGF